MENKGTTKLPSASVVKDWMYFYLGEWCAAKKFEKIGVSSKDVLKTIWNRIPRWSQDYMDDQEYFAEDMTVEYYLYGRLIGLGWKIQDNQETQNLAKMKKISLEEAKHMMKIPSGPTVFLDFQSTRIPAESEEDLKRFADMCDFVIEEQFMQENKKIPEGLKEISYEEAVKIFEDPDGPAIYLLLDDGVLILDDGKEAVAKTKEELRLHHEYGLKFGIKQENKKIFEGLKEISYEEAAKIFEDPNGPRIFILFDDGTEAIAETKEELKLHHEHGLKFGIEIPKV